MISGGLMVAAAVLGQCSSYGVQSYGYTPSYNYSYGYNQYYSAPYVKAKLTVVATEPDYGYGSLLGKDARYALKDKEEQEFRAELLAALKELKQQPQPAPEIQVFQSPRQPYVPQQAPQYVPAPTPQQPQPTSQDYQYAPQVPDKAPVAPRLGVPGKGFAPAPLPPQVPETNPNPAGSGGPIGQQGDWGSTVRPNEAATVLSSVLGNHCAGCHDDAGRAGGRSFFDVAGNPKQLSVQELRDIYRAVATGKMPQGAALPPAERTAMEDAIMFMFQTARR